MPSVSEELLNGVSRGYVALQAAVELIERGQRALVMPTAEQTLTKGALPQSFDAGERETAVLAKSRGEKILTNEQLVKNWCEREAGTNLDLPGILKSLWRTNFLTRKQVRGLIAQIEEKDRIVLKNQEAIFEE